MYLFCQNQTDLHLFSWKVRGSLTLHSWENDFKIFRFICSETSLIFLNWDCFETIECQFSFFFSSQFCLCLFLYLYTFFLKQQYILKSLNIICSRAYDFFSLLTGKSVIYKIEIYFESAGSVKSERAVYLA